MSDYVLNFGADYPLNGKITYFEAYMFSTTAKHMAEHRFVKAGSSECLDGSVYVIDGNSKAEFETLADTVQAGEGSVIVVRPDLGDRKSMMELFNKIIVRRGLSFPDPKDLSCAMIDFSDADKRYVPEEYRNVANEACAQFEKWCRENDRAGAAVQHLEQGNRLPHVHMLYQRGKDKHNEFQDWLASVLG